MLDPQTVQKLMKSKEIREFVSSLSMEVEKLNTIAEIETENPVEVAIEIKARKLAFEKLTTILEPFLNSREERETFNKNEYIT